jgi:hypothetical protein
VSTLRTVWALIEFVAGLRSGRELALIPTVLSVTDIPLCVTLEICTLVADFHIPIIPSPRHICGTVPRNNPAFRDLAGETLQAEGWHVSGEGGGTGSSDASGGPEGSLCQIVFVAVLKLYFEATSARFRK